MYILSNSQHDEVIFNFMVKVEYKGNRVKRKLPFLTPIGLKLSKFSWQSSISEVVD